MIHINLTSKEISCIVDRVKGPQWKMLDHEICSLSDDPIGFLGNHFLLKIRTIEKGNENKPEVLQLFMKTTPSVDGHAQYVEEIGAFKKEVIVQKTILKELLKSTSFLEHAWAPNCHLSKEDVLIFDDLSLAGYKLADGRETLDFNHCEAALKTLADFHAASIIWEENQKSITQKCYQISDIFPEATTEVCYIQKEGHARNNWLKSVTNATLHLCKLIGRSNESGKIPAVIDEALKAVGPSQKWRNVLSHGDLWSNNFMFRYNEDGSIKHCVLVDYQFARYAPAALDLTCCIYLTATLSLRQNHMGYFFNTYYEQLTEVLSTAGLKIENIIPRNELVDGYQKYRILGILESIFYGTTIWIPKKIFSAYLSDPNECVDVTSGNRNGLVETAFMKDDFFRQQMTDLVGELLDCTATIG